MSVNVSQYFWVNLTESLLSKVPPCFLCFNFLHFDTSHLQLSFVCYVSSYEFWDQKALETSYCRLSTYGVLSLHVRPCDLLARSSWCSTYYSPSSDIWMACTLYAVWCGCSGWSWSYTSLNSTSTSGKLQGLNQVKLPTLSFRLSWTPTVSHSFHLRVGVRP